MLMSTPPPSRVLVVGTGIIGLRTAVELLKNRFSVVLVSPVSPHDPSVCSQGAGGLWMPYHNEDSPRFLRWAKETLDELYPMAVDPACPHVERVPCVSWKANHSGPTIPDFLATDYHQGTGGTSPLPSWTKDPRLEFQHMTVEMLEWQNQVLGLRLPDQTKMLLNGYTHAWLFNSPVVDSPAMLSNHISFVENHELTADMKLETNQWYNSMDEIIVDAKAMNCDAVVNCTGLGARRLLPNEERLIGARGILMYLDRSLTDWDDADVKDKENMNRFDAAMFVEDGPWGSETEPSYLIPRGDKIVVGGSYLEGDTRTEISETERQRLILTAERFGIRNVESAFVEMWTGFRPSRSTAVCEIDTHHSDLSNITVINSFGHGGSGWTVATGVAKDTVKLLQSI
jgi:D-amino-acid oxidase